MRYQISGRHIDIGEALQEHVRTELDIVTSKYAGRPTSAAVVFSKVAHEASCEITVHLSTGLIAQARGRDPEIYAAFAKANERLAKQLRRNKRRLKDHYIHRPEPVELFSASAYILAPTEEIEEPEPQELNPHIIADMPTSIPSLSVGEAVMQLELADVPVLVFQNEKNSGLNVVYRRDDGNIGWIDPNNTGL